MARRSVMLAVAVWTAVVVAASLATWTVIDSAGRGVLTAGDARSAGADPTPMTAASSTSSLLPQPTASPGRRAASGRKGTSPKARPTATRPPAAPQTQATALPGSGTTPRGSTPPRGSGTGGSSAPTTRPQPAPAPKPAPAPAPARVRTWQGAAGTVTARCVGERVSLVSASPADGWRMEVGDRGPDRVEVHFEGAGHEREIRASEEATAEDGSDREATVRSQCSGGTPTFRVNS